MLPLDNTGKENASDMKISLKQIVLATPVYLIRWATIVNRVPPCDRLKNNNSKAVNVTFLI
jgi:hypothetical protein